MIDQHPVTPPEGLVLSLRNSAPHGIRDSLGDGVIREIWLINHAYAAGADQELEACCEWLEARINEGWNLCHLKDLLNTRRPKLPSLKEQALEQLRALDQQGALDCNTDKIRRALEQLND